VEYGHKNTILQITTQLSKLGKSVGKNKKEVLISMLFDELERQRESIP
jgi:hypothetical protein